MRRAVILHGTDGKPEDNWFPWLKQKLQEAGCEVWIPELPHSHTPDREAYADFLFSQGWDYTDGIIIGHSSGAVETLNLLMDERLPHVKLAIMVAAWASLDVPEDYKLRLEAVGLHREQFENLFPPDGFDFGLIRSKADRLAFIHGSDDPFCPLEQARYLAQQLEAPLTVVPQGHHLGTRFTTLPPAWNLIQPVLE